MVHFQVRARLRIETAAVFAGAFGELFVAGRAPEFRCGASDVVDVALEVRVSEAYFGFFYDGSVAAGLYDAAFVEGQRAEVAVTETPSVGSQTEFDLAKGRDAAILLVRRMIGAHERQRVDVVHLLRCQRFRGRILHYE